jgi:glycosyltransferase involved in cell wall biosynthesis
VRLAFWCTSYIAGFGGAEKMVNDLLNRLVTRDKQIFLVAREPRDGEPVSDPYAPLHPAVSVYRNSFANPFDDLRRPYMFFVRWMQYLKAAIQVGLYLRRNRIELVHLHYVSFDVVLLVLLKWLLGYKLIITFSGSDVHLATPGNLAGAKLRLAVRHADRVTAVSRDLCRRLTAGFECADPVFLPNGVDVQQVRRQAADSFSPVEDGHLIFCGRLTAIKRVPFLVDAFHRAVQNGCSLRLYIVGDGEEADRIDQHISHLDIGDRVIRVGALTHAQALNAISRSRCLVLSSSNEGLPLVVLEAMALGRPVIAPDTGGLGEMVVHGQNGYLYPTDRPDLLTDSLVAVSRDRGLADRLGARGPEAIRGAYSLDSVVERYCQIYRETLHAAS